MSVEGPRLAEGTPHLLWRNDLLFMTLIVQSLNFPIFRLKESGAINGSLFALGQVVDALNQGLVRSHNLHVTITFTWRKRALFH